MFAAEFPGTALSRWGAQMVWPFCGSNDEDVDAWLSTSRTPRHVPGFNLWLESQTGEIRSVENRPRAERTYLELLENLGPDAHGALPTVSIDSDPGQPMYDRILAKLQACDRFGASFANTKKINFKNKWLTTLKTGASEVVDLRNCQVTKLIVGPGPVGEANIVGCSIGELVFAGQIKKFKLWRCDVRKIAISQQDFLSGPVSIKQVSLPTEEASVQALRQLRAELVSIHNLDAAGPVHAAEQWISRKELGFTDWFFSVLYGVVSAYGSSTLRPLGWSFALAGVSAAIVFASAGTVLTDRPLLGWQNQLSGTTEAASAARAAYLTLNQILNPLGIFGINPLVISTDAWIAGASAFICFLATVSLGLFALALRRRFRLDGR